MYKSNRLNLIVIGFLIGIGAAFLFIHETGKKAGPQNRQETTFERVMRTQTIKCGYALSFPDLMRDPNTGAFSGIMYDYLEALGTALHLKIQWSEEIGWSDFPEALKAGRIDAVCANVWPNAARALRADFTNPLFYNAVYAYARAGDKRFYDQQATVNDPSVTISSIDGEASGFIAATDFPKAKVIQLPQLSNISELFINVTSKKADIAFQESSTVEKFNKDSDIKLHRVLGGKPLRVFGCTIAVALGQDTFRRMLNTATDELRTSGQIEKILSKYEAFPGALLRVAPMYME